MNKTAVSNYNFTQREIEVIDLLIKGCTNPEIARQLFISTHTAKAHVCSIIHKMRVPDRTHAIIKLLQGSYQKLPEAVKMYE